MSSTPQTVGAPQGGYFSYFSKAVNLAVPNSQLITQIIGYMILFIFIIIFLVEVFIVRDTNNLLNGLNTSQFNKIGNEARTLVVVELIMWFFVGPLVLFATTWLHERTFIGFTSNVLAYGLAGIITFTVGIIYKLTGIDRLFLSPADPTVRKSFWSTFFSNDMNPSVEKVIVLLKTSSFVIMSVFIAIGVIFTLITLNTNIFKYIFPTVTTTPERVFKFLVDVFVLPFVLMIPVLLRIVYVNKVAGRKVLRGRAFMIWFLFFVTPTIIFMMFFSLLHVINAPTYDVRLGILTKGIQGEKVNRPKVRQAILNAAAQTLFTNLKPEHTFDNFFDTNQKIANTLTQLSETQYLKVLNSYLNVESSINQTLLNDLVARMTDSTLQNFAKQLNTEIYTILPPNFQLSTVQPQQKPNNVTGTPPPPPPDTDFRLVRGYEVPPGYTQFTHPDGRYYYKKPDGKTVWQTSLKKIQEIPPPPPEPTIATVAPSAPPAPPAQKTVSQASSDQVNLR